MFVLAIHSGQGVCCKLASRTHLRPVSTGARGLREHYGSMPQRQRRTRARASSCITVGCPMALIHMAARELVRLDAKNILDRLEGRERSASDQMEEAIKNV